MKTLSLSATVLASLVCLVAAAAEIVPESGDWSGNRALGADDILVLDVSEGSTKAYSGVISGTGKVRKIGCGILQLTGDNSDFSGEWLVTTGRVEVTTAANLGAASSVKIWATANKHTGILYFGCTSAQTFANPIRIMGPGAGYTLSGDNNAMYRQIHAQVAGTGANPAKVTLAGQITAEAGCARFWVSSYGSNGSLYVDDVNVPGVDFYPISGSSSPLYCKRVRAKILGGTICTKQLYPGTANEYYAGGIYFQSTADVECDELADNYVCMTFNKTGTFTKSGGGWPVFNLARYCNGTGNSVVDLNGFSQTFDRMIGPARDPKKRGVGGASCTGGRLRSGSAATVTLKGTANAETAVDVIGKVSIVWDPAGDYTQRFANSLSDTSGSLTVKGGTLEFTGETTFSNVTTVAVEDGASFTNKATAAGSLNKLASLTVGAGAVFAASEAPQPFVGTTPITIYLAADSELYLPTDTTVNVADIYVDGKRIAGGSYTAGGARTFPQLKSGAIEAPVRPGDYDLFTWTGGGADKLLTTGENWKETAKPDFSGEFAGAKFGDAGDEALVPDGVKIAHLVFTRPFALVPAVSGAAFSLSGGMEIEGANSVTIQSGISIPFSQTWDVGTAELAFTGPLTGEPGTTVSVVGTAKEISFTGGVGSTYPGSIAFCDAPNVTASGENPFGGAGGLVSWSNTVNKAQKISLSNFSTSKDILMHSTAADFDKIEVTEGTAVFNGSFTSARSLHFNTMANTKAIFNGPKLSLNATLVAEGQGEFILNSPLLAAMIQTESPLIVFGATGNRITHEIGINLHYLGNSNRKLKFAVAEAFDDRTTLTLTAETSDNGEFDLCGYNQTFGTLTMLTTANGRPTKVVITNSGERATLHIVQKKERARSEYPLAWIAGRILGPIDFWKSGVASTVVSNHIAAAGALKVTHAGLVFAANDGSWKNATDVIIADDPTEAINAGEEPFVEVRSNNALGTRANLTISGSGTLNLAAGVTQRVKSCTAGGVELCAGAWRHGATYSAENRTTPYLAGDGTLLVQSGFIMVVK